MKTIPSNNHVTRLAQQMKETDKPFLFMRLWFKFLDALAERVAFHMSYTAEFKKWKAANRQEIRRAKALAIICNEPFDEADLFAKTNH